LLCLNIYLYINHIIKQYGGACHDSEVESRYESFQDKSTEVSIGLNFGKAAFNSNLPADLRWRGLIVDFKFSGKYILVVGGGTEGYLKVLRLLDDRPKIQVVSRDFADEMVELEKMKKVELVKAEIKDAKAFIRNLMPKPDVVIAVTDDQKLNRELVVEAKSLGCLVYAVDDPEVSDFTFPALARIGEVKVAISTGGKSPAMAGILRRRVERMITEEDLLQIRLQHYVRAILKKKVPDQRVRKMIVYKILENERISKLLKEKKFDEALEEAVKIVEEHQESYRLA